MPFSVLATSCLFQMRILKTTGTAIVFGLLVGGVVRLFMAWHDGSGYGRAIAIMVVTLAIGGLLCLAEVADRKRRTANIPNIERYCKRQIV